MNAVRVSIGALLLVALMVLAQGTSVAVADTDPPKIVSLTISPSVVEIGNSSQALTFTAHITDDLSGANHNGSNSQARFRSPSGNQFIDAIWDGYHRISGTEKDGIYEAVATVPQFSETGRWTLEYMELVDNVGNTDWIDASEFGQLGLPNGFDVSDDIAAKVHKQCLKDGKIKVCAWVSIGKPSQHSNVTVYGSFARKGIGQSGKRMTTAWHYRTTTSQCGGITDAQGLALCSRNIGSATKGYRVNIDVTIKGRTVTTWFTPK